MAENEMIIIFFSLSLTLSFGAEPQSESAKNKSTMKETYENRST